jgi:hypothetical protein
VDALRIAADRAFPGKQDRDYISTARQFIRLVRNAPEKQSVIQLERQLSAVLESLAVEDPYGWPTRLGRVVRAVSNAYP